MVTATYKGRAYQVLGDDGKDNVELEDWTIGRKIWVYYGDENLIIEPTDEQWFACENVGLREP